MSLIRFKCIQLSCILGLAYAGSGVIHAADSASPNSPQTHEIISIGRKPAVRWINRTTTENFSKRAAVYDQADQDSAKRRLFTAGANQQIATRLRKHGSIRNLLSVACGTGRREIEIRDLMGSEFPITGVEASPVMCDIARAGDLTVVTGRWPYKKIIPGTPFDAALTLTAIGHVPTSSGRIRFAKTISQHLKPNGIFIFDAFAMSDQYEWGPEVHRRYHDENMKAQGYEYGDIFYQTTFSEAPAFLHLFTENEIETMLHAAQFSKWDIDYVGYVKNSGEPVEKGSGSMLVTAIK